MRKGVKVDIDNLVQPFLKVDIDNLAQPFLKVDFNLF